MADQTYTVELNDQVTPGLAQIAKGLDSSTKKTNKFDDILKQVDKDIAKISKTPKSIVPKTESKGLERLDKTLNVLGPTVGKVAGNFGFLGDLVEGVSGKMIGMGGAAGYIGAGLLAVGVAAGAAAAGIYAYFKWFSAIEDAHASFNKSLRIIHGSLGKYGDKDREVMESSMKLHVGLGKSADDTAKDIAAFTRATGDIKGAEQFASLKASMEGLGYAGVTANKVLDAIANKKISSVSLKDIQETLVTLGVSADKAAQEANKIYNAKDAKKQLAILTQNREMIAKIGKDAAASVTPMERLKLQFQDTIAKAFGSQGPTPLGNLLDKITAWLQTSDAQQRFNELFTSISTSLAKITPENIDEFIDSIESGIKSLKGFFDTLSEIGKWYDDHPILAKTLLGAAAGGAVGGLPGAVIGAAGGAGLGAIDYYAEEDVKNQQWKAVQMAREPGYNIKKPVNLENQIQEALKPTIEIPTNTLTPQTPPVQILQPVQPVQPIPVQTLVQPTPQQQIQQVSQQVQQAPQKTQQIKTVQVGEIKVTVNGIINSKDLELAIKNVVNKTVQEAALA